MINIYKWKIQLFFYESLSCSLAKNLLKYIFEYSTQILENSSTRKKDEKVEYPGTRYSTMESLFLELNEKTKEKQITKSKLTFFGEIKIFVNLFLQHIRVFVSLEKKLYLCRSFSISRLLFKSKNNIETPSSTINKIIVLHIRILVL